MTRLSEALKRAAEQSSPSAVADATSAAVGATTVDVTPPVWQFSPVETMHVPVEPARVAPSAPPAPDPPPGIDRRNPHVSPLRFGAADAGKLVVSPGAASSVIEQYRHLAAVMHQAQEASGVKSVMVTSALPSEGKTLTAANLALTLSESYNRRVLVIDADLRRPRMHELFALPPGQGLSDVLTGERGGRLPVHSVTPHLWVLGAGRAVVDPMSSLVSQAMKQLLDDARASFDFVIVDTPPIAILTDAGLLAGMIDTALLVVSAQATPYPMVQRAATALGTNRILGVVLNRAEQLALPETYSYYGGPKTAPAPKSGGWLGRWRKGRKKPDVQ
jgi:capsular exopolysaccharide synthesis family protein